MTGRRKRRRRQRRWRARAWSAIRNKHSRERLSRRRKCAIHALLIVGITACLGYEGAKMADWGFVFLAVACEFS